MNDIEKLLQTNLKLSDLIQQYSKDQSTSFINHDASFTPILRQLILNAEKNVESVDSIQKSFKKFAMALLIYAGPLLYDFIHSNLPEAFYLFILYREPFLLSTSLLLKVTLILMVYYSI